MPERRASPFADILRTALALSAEDQARLVDLLQRINAYEAAPPPPAARTAIAASGLEQQQEQEQSLEDWLQQMQNEPAWTQLLALEDALAGVQSDEERSLLQTVRTQLLQANPAIAVRHAVVGVACQHPVGICVGALGLTVGVAGLVRVLLRIVF